MNETLELNDMSIIHISEAQEVSHHPHEVIPLLELRQL